MQTMQDIRGNSEPAAAHPSDRSARRGSPGAAIVRIALGVTIVATWWENLTGDLNTADGLNGFFNWLYTPVAEGGNGSSLGFFQSFLENVIRPVAGPFGIAQGVLELALGLALIFGVATRLSSLAAAGFFFSVFLAYFGGEEWIWTYVLLMAGSVAVFLDWGGRRFGLDAAIATRRGESQRGLVY